MFRIIKYTGLSAVFAVLGCQAQTSNAPHIETQSSVSISLPSEFSESYKIAFEQNPVLTAQRFLQAFDNFEKFQPVTTEAVKDHARLQASLEQGQLLGGILAVDLNNDNLITRIKY